MNEIYLSSTKSYIRSKDLVFLMQVIISNENILFSKEIIDFLGESHIFERKHNVSEANN